MRGTTPRAQKGKTKPPAFAGKDPIGMAKHQVQTKVQNKTLTPAGGWLQPAPRHKIASRKDVGEAYLASLKSGTVKLEQPKSFPKGPFAPKGFKRSFKDPKGWSPQNAYPTRGRTKMIPSYQGGPGH